MSKLHATVKQRGVTSIFIVIFAALLFSMIAISFASLMNREQQRSSDDEMSQSAYDSAMAGVEDAKRVMLLARGSSPAATQAQQAIDSGECNTIRASGLIGGDTSSQEEVIIQSTTAETGSGSELQQAYSCVIVNTNSPDYKIDLSTTMQSKLVPLSAVDEFDRVKISWHQTADGSAQGPCSQPFGAVAMPLCTVQAWGGPSPQIVPALLRTQFVTPGDSFNLADLDRAPAGNTVFLYPRTVGLGNVAAEALPRHVDGGDHDETGHKLERARCSSGLGISQTYHCSAVIELESSVAAESEVALLRVAAYYNTASVGIELYNGSADVPANRVDFAGVQPRVDSTGRTNDLFRRVEARIGLAPDVTYPEFALDVGGSLCKHFYVINTTSPPSTTAFALPHLGSCTP